MLFNKHSETKQRFGIRKLTIGATSVLLSTLFLTVNNGQKVHAATNETVTSTDNKSGTEDNTATTEEKQTGDVATTADKSSDTSTPEDKVSSEGKTEDVTNTEEVTKPASGQKKFATTDKTMKIFTKMLVAAPAPSTTSLSDDGLVATDDQGVTLSMSKNTLGEGGQLGNSGITVKFSGSVSAGDIYTIQVPDFGWGYGWGQYGPINDSTITTAGALGNFATAKKTNVVIDGQNYANYQITFKQGITIDSKGFQIVLNNGNNYYGQGRPSTTIKDGKYYQNIYWSRSSQADPTKITKNPTLSFIRKVETGFNKPTFTMTAPDGNKVTKLEPDTDYQFTLNLNQGTGLNGLTDNTAAQINSARNYGSVITIPVPEGFVLNQALSMQGSQIEDKTTIEQVGGAGGDIIITVPKGSGRQNYESKPGYIIAGRFINHPKTTTTFTANGNGNENGNITVTEKVLTKDGTGTKEIKAVLPPWQITMLGQKDAPTEGEFAIQAWGNNNGNRFTQTVPTKIANYFNFTNNSGLQYENNLHLTFDFDDGLAISALSTPKIDDIARYGTRSYTYTLTLTDGTKITGRINAGDKIEIPDKTMTITAKSHDQDGKVQFNDMVVPVTIKSADLVPNFWAAGAHGDNYLNYRTGWNFGNNQFISNETFMAYGYISDALNNDPYLPDKTYVSSKLTVSSPSYRPNTTFYATDTQLVASKNTIQSALWASGSQHANNRYYSPDIDYTKGDYGTISIDVSNDSKKASNRIVEPIFYYVLPNYTNFTGDLTNIINPNPGITDGDKSKENIKPKLTSYMVGNQQVVKLDYSGTGFVYDANKKSNTLPIAIDADAEPGVYKWNVYIYTATGIVNQNPITNASDVANDYTQNVVEEQKNAGKTGSLYMIGSGDWEIKTPPVAYAPNTVQGNLDVKSVANGKSDDKGSEEMNYATEIANYSSGSIKDPYMLINFPQADPNKNGFTFELTGPEEFIALNNNLGKDDFTTYYSTKTQDLPTVKDRGKVPDMTGYVTAGQVTDWSKIKSAVIKFNTTLPGGTVLGQIVFKGKDSTLKTDAGKTSYFRAAVMGETINPFLTENTSIKVVGKSTVNTRLHYQDTDRQDHYINVPTMTKEYNDNVDPMNSSDFDLNSIPKELIPDHYELVANQTPSIINNEDGNSKDATAEFNKMVTYAFDGDIVQFELEPKIDKATQTINRTVHFRTDGDNSEEVAEDVSTPVTVTELTNEVTGEKQYSAIINVAGKNQDLAVSVDKDGKISIKLPEVTIPNIKNYYVVDSTKDEANALTHTFTFTKDAKEVLENTVKYAPVKQELQIRVYDDEGEKPSEALDTKETGVTVYFTGNSETSFPSEVQTSLEKLKEYYERKNYEIKNLPNGRGQFDDTSNGDATTDSNPQYVDIHLEHGLKFEKENKTVTRTINYYDQDKNQLINDANSKISKVTEPQTVTRTVSFERYAVRDQVTNQIIGYATPDQVTTTGGQTTLKQADGYTHTTGQASDATAGFVITSDSKTLPSQVNYDLSKYGYEAPTTADRASFAQVDEVTPKATDDDTVVNVYYREKVVTVTSEQPKSTTDKITDDHGYDHNYPAGVDQADLNNTVTRTISSKYSDKDGTPWGPVDQKVSYKRDATIDLVKLNKEDADAVTYTNWEPAEAGKESFDSMLVTHVEPGYVADCQVVPSADVTKDKDGKAQNGQNIVVTYSPVGVIIPVDKDGNEIPGAPTPKYNNDENDPTKVTTTYVPKIPGYHPEVPSVTPDKPGDNTKVVYVKNTQAIDLVYVDVAKQVTLETQTSVAQGDSDSAIPASVAETMNSTLQSYLDKGYVLDSKEDMPSTFDNSDQNADGSDSKHQVVTVYLKHGTEVVSGKDPKTPGTPINPDDPDSPNYGEETSREHLVIKSVDVIEYEGAGDKTPETNTRTNDATLIKNVTIDKVTGEVIATGEWTGKFIYESIKTPKIDGYTVSLENAGGTAISSGDANEAVAGVITRKVKVVYTPEKQELQLKVYDQDLDKYLGKTDSFYGLTDQEVGEDPQTRLDELKKQFAERGFDIVEVPELAKNYDNTENGTSDQDNKPQVFVLVVKHHIETVTPDDPKTPDDKIPNTNQNYPGGLTETDLSKTITRTIIVHMPDGSTKEIKQEVVYTRTATVDSVTKEVTYTDWTSKNSNWSEYQSPDIPGYTVDIEKVELAKVPVDGHDVTVEINYTADPVPDEPVNPSNPGNPGTTTPDQPQQPGKPTDPTKPSEPNKPSNPGRPTNPNHPTKPTKPVTPAKPDQTHDQHSKVKGETDLNGFVYGISDEKAGAVAGTSDNAQAGAKKLPQTSGESGWQASLLGMGLFFISLFGFKKKKEDE